MLNALQVRYSTFQVAWFCALRMINMKKQLFSLGLILLAASSSAMAVDGYKGVKFGASFNELNAAKMCTWVKNKDDIKGVTSYFCDDFKFSGKRSNAAAFFINGKFERFAIGIEQNVITLFDELVKKYGYPSSSPTTEETDRYQSQGGAMHIKFDNDTVIIGCYRDGSNGSEEMELVYSTNEFDGLYKELQGKSVENDI